MLNIIHRIVNKKHKHKILISLHFTTCYSNVYRKEHLVVMMTLKKSINNTNDACRFIHAKRFFFYIAQTFKKTAWLCFKEHTENINILQVKQRLKTHTLSLLQQEDILI